MCTPIQSAQVVAGSDASASEAWWRRCVEVVDASLGEELGQEFVVEAFPLAAKAKVEEMVGMVKSSFRTILRRDVSWLGRSAQQEAEEKLLSMKAFVGYPERRHDDRPPLGLLHARQFARNVAVCRQASSQLFFRQLRTGLDNTVWDMSPASVNAYYTPQSSPRTHITAAHIRCTCFRQLIQHSSELISAC